MKAYELGKLLSQLPQDERQYVVNYFLGGLDCVASGFTEPHKDQAHAQWAIDQFCNALINRPRDGAALKTAAQGT